MNRLTNRDWILPATLRGRLTVSVVLGSIALFTLVWGVISVATAQQAKELTTADALVHLNSVEQVLKLEARELDSFAVNYTNWDDFYAQTTNLDPAWVGDQLDPWLRSNSGATLVLWVNNRGGRLFEYGDRGDLEAVHALATSSKDLPVTGPMHLSNGPCVVSVRPIVGEPEGPSVGYLVIARPIGRVLSEFQVPDHIRGMSATGAALEVPEGWRDLKRPGGFDRVVGRFVSGTSLDVRAAISGVDGRPAGVIEFTDADPWAEVSNYNPGLFALGLGLVSLFFGLLFGLMLARFIRDPIEHFVAYLRDQGYLAIEGLPFEERLEIDSRLPVDLKRLGTIIQDVLIQLRQRQSALKAANDQMMAAEHALRTVVNDSSEAKLLVVNGTVDIVNPAAAEWLNSSVGELIGMPIEQAFGNVTVTTEAAEPLDVDSLIAAALKRPVKLRFDVPGDEPFWMSVSLAETASDDSYLLTARNITEEHQVEEIRAEIVSLVSHDLRSPLTVISGYLDLLALPLAEDKREKVVAEMRAATVRMTTMLDNLLDTARTERALAPVRFEEVDLSDLAEEAAAAAGVSAGVPVRASRGENAIVLGDHDRLRQAVDNLVNNALKHSPAGGEVRLVVETHDGNGVLAVEDDGPGVPVAERDNVFKRYRQLRPDDARTGVGLGLYIVKAIAENHGGTASVEDAAGGGARFVIAFPLAPGAVALR